jgi:hypothetical protein
MKELFSARPFNTSIEVEGQRSNQIANLLVRFIHKNLGYLLTDLSWKG